MSDSPFKKGLGRRKAHDPRSVSYRVAPTFKADEIKSVEHKRISPILDQGDLGSCTGNATVGALGTEPFYATIPGVDLNEALAVEIYSAATKLDDFQGDYPPDDTGTDGNSVAKAARNLGYISGWQHITGVDAAKSTIQSVPFIFGTNWYNSMFEPDADGTVHVTGGEYDIAGGHEIECVGYNVEDDVWKFANSWGDGWGNKGYFYLSGADFERLLNEDGDATVFVAVSLPAPEPNPEPQPVPVPVDPTPTPDPEPTPTPQPEPTPTPGPTPTPTPDVSDFPSRVVTKWVRRRHYTKREEQAADAIERWMQDNDLL